MNKDKLSIDLINSAEEYWNKIIEKDYEKIILSKKLKKNEALENETRVLVCPSTFNKLTKMCRNSDQIIHMTILTVLKIAIHKYFENKEFLIGIPQYLESSDNKNNNQFIVVDNKINQENTFKEALISGKKEIADSYLNQFYPLKELYKNADIYNKVNFYCCMEDMHNRHQIEDILKLNNNEITLIIEKKNESIELNFKYSDALTDNEVNKLTSVFVNILDSVIESIEIKLKDIELISAEEKHKLLVEFNDTVAKYPKNKTIHELFEEQVEKTPDNIAIVFEDKKLTYRELNKKANRLARTLREKGIKPDSIVGIMLERSVEMIVGVMAILKAGGAYLPIIPSYPKERIEYMLKDSDSKILLSTETLVDNLKFDGEVIDLFYNELLNGNSNNLEKVNKSNDLAYVIYTSGTTGKPKGVLIEHNNVVRLMFNDKMQFEFNNNDVWTMFHSFCFDFSVWEMYGALLYGGKLVIVPDLVTKDFEKYLLLLKEEKVTVLNQTPSAFYNLMNIEVRKKEKDLNLRYIIFGGEALNPQRLFEWKQKYNETKLINMYGITETTVHVTFKEITKEDIEKRISNIGRAIPTLTTYVMDENLKLRPIGVPGELCVGGDGVARGYLNRKELTKSKFVVNPYVPNEIIYRSGDKARLLKNGDLEYLGRIDNQVKIRGFRIELGEIKNCLLSNEHVKEAAVVIRESKKNDKFIYAYLVSDEDIHNLNLKVYLKESLPEYMIPTYFVQLEKMPLTSNGKLDVKSLPEPNFDSILDKYEAARNEIEETLVEIWEDILGVKKVGINDNFFDLGGHSLKATTLTSRIHKELNVEVPLKEIFSVGNIKGLSEYIESINKKEYIQIEKVKEKEYYEASSAQKRIYTLQELNKDSTAYNMPGAVEILGELELVRMKEAFLKLIKRHETLRTSFYAKEGNIIQKVKKLEEIEFDIESIDVNSEEEAKAKIKEFIKPFNLQKELLLRVVVIRLEKDRHIMVYDMHHIISDGISMSILTKEFNELYLGKELEELKIQYKDYSAWQLKKRENGELEKQEEYWLKEFSGEIPVMNLPTDYRRPKVKDFSGDSIRFVIDKETTESLIKIAKETGSTLYMVLLANIKILLSKYSGQEDIIVGSPIAGRNHRDLENIIGMFVNTLAIRSTIDSELSFKEFLKVIKDKALRAYENQDYQFEELVDKVDIERNLSRNPLFDVMFVLQNMEEGNIDVEGLIFKSYDSSNNVEKFDITMTAFQGNDEIYFNLSYATSLYKHETIERLAYHFLNIVKETTKNTEAKLKEIELLSAEDKHKLLVEFNDTAVEYKKNKTIHQLFEEQVEKTPNNIAVVFEDKKLTYRELNERSNQLARVLRKKGIGSECIVGIMVERSIEMIVGIMGILKSGGAYLPLDPKYPEDRIKYMLKDSGTNILLTQKNIKNKVNFNGIRLMIDDKELYKENKDNLKKINSSSDLAYVIYTSGTTGNPKGVMIEHKNVAYLITALSEKIYKNYDNNLNVALIAPYVFDASVQQIFAALDLGHALHIISDDVKSDGNKIVEYYREKSIHISDGTPIHLKLISEADLTSSDELKIKHFIIGGDKLHINIVKELLERFDKNKPIVTNVYGPTECCVDSTAYTINNTEINKIKDIPIGTALANSRVYILDANLKLTSVNGTGEIYISGNGLARGYLNRPELTVEKFVDNPFEAEQKMYRTGDLARWLPDGNIEFIGRIDNQVKVRGFRIELGEIESNLLKIEGVKEVVVLDKGEEGNKYLCAYYVADKDFSITEFRRELRKLLPDYMIPSYFIKLENMPLTTNGKINRKSLPEPDGNINTGVEYEAPRNKIEEKLVEIWKEILGVNNIGINDNFFEIGGHSLKAIILTGRIYKELNVEVPLKEIFSIENIKGLSEYIESINKKEFVEIEKVEEKEYYEASSAQKRIYTLQELNKDSTAYNMPGAVEILGELELARIKGAFLKLIKRHQTLRTNFYTKEGNIIQKVNKLEEIEFDIESIEVNSEEEAKEKIKEFIKPFNLQKELLLRVVVIRLEKDRHIMVYDMHHIISDGISMSILTKEFNELYLGKELEELKIQYKDYSAWQSKKRENGELEKQEEYWLKEFSGEIPVINLPTDYRRPKVKDFSGDSLSFVIDKETTESLIKIAKETGSTLYMVLLANIKILLSKYSGQEDIIVGSPIAGRNHRDLENIIGMFVNTLAIRSTIDSELSFKELLKVIKEKAIRAYENQDYQFEELVDKVDIERNLSRNPLFDVMFVFQNMEEGNLDVEGLTFKSYDSSNNVEKFDITITAFQGNDEIYINLSYATSLYKHETIERIANHFLNIVKETTKNTGAKLKEIDLLSAEEKHKLLVEFNDTVVEYKKNKTIHQLFEEQVEKTPNNIAVVFEEKKLTYRELNEKSNQLARVLINKGICSERIVGIMVERSPEMIIAIMGVLKAGGTYLPIDLNYPKERIEYMLMDSESSILLTSENLISGIEFNGEIIDLFNQDLFGGDSSNLDVIINSSDLAYVIYTSGTTGNPKGVMIEHRSLINYIGYAIREYYGEEMLHMPLYTSVAFDLTVTSIFTPLLSGNTVVTYKEKDINKLMSRVFETNNKSIIKLTPAHLSLLKEMNYTNRSIKKFIVGGEELTEELAKYVSNLFENNVEIINEYGPTEATVGCIVYKYDYKNKYKNSVLIGKPIDNTKIYIMGNEGELLPIGISGELCIAGDGLARGYLNKHKLTAEKFVDNPFEPGEKIYKTGDLARWLPDGNIEFLGRIDNQVKIRGYRIELGEIENRVLEYEHVKEAVVVVKENKTKEKYICAYVISEKEVSVLDLKSYLKKYLPEYMVPSYIVQIQNMPLTHNGKLNRKALPEPNLDSNLIEYEAPRNEVEEKMSKIWGEVLGVKKVGINDDFFELGGHSLKATVLISKIHKVLNKDVPLKELFNFPTIKELSRFIDHMEENIYSDIKKVEEREYYEASSAQKRMYMLQEFEKSSTAYNMPILFEIEGEVDKERIEGIFAKLSVRHDAFKTYFEAMENEILQKIDYSYEFKMQFRKCDKEDIENIVKGFIKPFDLNKAPLLRVELVEQKEKTYLLIDMHHIISDGVSMSILVREFVNLYNGKTLEPLEIQYKDFAAWQNEFLKSEEIKKQEEYWINKFSDEIPVLNLPYDYERPVVKSFEGDYVSFEVDEKITLELRKLAKETGSTMHMVLLSAFNILLSKYSRQEDIIVGTPIAGRPHADLQNIMGMFVNTLALRNKPERDKKYIEFLKDVKENSLKAYENQSYQLEVLIEKLNIRRDTSRNPLFDVMFNIMDTANDDIELDEVTLREYGEKNKISKFDLTLNALENHKTLEFNFEYCTKIFNRETIKRLSNHYIKILDQITNNSEIKISEINLLREDERKKILYDFNDTKVDYPKNRTIQELFEEQVEKTPDNIAVVFGDEKLTYNELNEKSNQLARVLRNKGIKSGSIVGIMVEKSLEMIVGMMGIVKAGGAYLPIDPNYPKERIEYMLKDSESDILVSTKKIVTQMGYIGEFIDLLENDFLKYNSGNLEKITTPNDLAYVIYTSGTTGKPKGIMIEHESLVNLCSFYNKKFNITEFDKSTSYASFSFDASVWEIWPCLVGGAALYIIDENTRLDIEKLNKYYIQNGITVSYLPTQICEQFLNIKNSSLRILTTGGEKLNFYTENKFEFFNNYGPSENTVGATSYLVESLSRNIPIGKPIDNTKVYILDKGYNLSPIGVPGELCLSGSGLARGYLNRPELTAEKFVDNPFKADQKMYRTGDLARWLPDGNIEFLGRIDNQVKIRGFRIELGEIERNLFKIDGIKEVVVLDKGQEKNKYLCAYYVGEKEYSVVEFRGELKKSLPDYMIPSYFIKLEKMPLTANGKVERKLLPEPDGNINTGMEYEAPRNEIEEKLVEIWQEILGVNNIGINDNFFELGGHSLKATTLTGRIYKELNVEVPLKEIFSIGNIKGLSEYIELINKKEFKPIEKIEEKEYYEASSAQKRIYTLQELSKDSAAYNMPCVMEVVGEFEVIRMKKAFLNLIKRHETLRTSFYIEEGNIIQKVHPLEEINFEIENIQVNSEEEATAKIKEFIRPFNLQKAPLLRAAVIRLEKDRHIMLYDIHHIISDGISMSILTKEFSELYDGKKLKELKVQYKDYSAWQLKKRENGELEKQEEYWLKEFSGEIPVLNILTDYTRPKVKDFSGDSINFVLDKETTESLTKIAKETGSTLYMVLLANIKILLSKYSGQEDIIVGSPIAGRNHRDLENIIGMFVNTLAIKSTVDSELNFKEYLKVIKEKALKAYENQDYQFEELVDKLDIERNLSRNPLFDVMFVFQNMEQGNLDLEGLIFKSYHSSNNVEKFDVTMTAVQGNDQIYINLSYATSLYKHETIERLANHFLNIVKETTKNTEVKLKEIDLLSAEEKHKLLVEFNDTAVEYKKNKAIHQLFEEQVEKAPNNIAVVFEDKELTYRELNEQSNQLAEILRNRGIKADSIVGIMIERSIEMIVGIMGTLKAGGAYLPIDSSYPKERIEYMLKDSESSILLTSENLIGGIEFNGEIIDLLNQDLSGEDSSNLDIIINSSDLAYVIYTSGTTGKPKGVMIEHGNIINTLIWRSDYYNFNNNDAVLQIPSYSFDSSVEDIFTPLISGAKLVIIDQDRRLDMEYLKHIINKNCVTNFLITPGLYSGLLRSDLKNIETLTKITVAGESIQENLVIEHFNKLPKVQLFNEYGPTENSVCSSCYQFFENNSKVLIGKPIYNTKVYIADKFNNILPIGVKGELCVSGDGLARGYLNNEKLTSQKFVDNPYELGQKMYRTGDLAKWLPDGNIEFLGRIDHQVKIRGFRIELGEIERNLLKIDGLKEIIVLDKGEEGNKYLCAYYVSKKEYSISKIREELKKSLPDYMIPSYFIKLENMPLTANGKLDRKSLPEPDGNINTGIEYEAPGNEIEEKLVEIWQEILGVNNIGINDNFFELGGHSLKATVVINKIHEALNVEVPLNELFKNPTIKSVGKYINKLEENKYSLISKVEKNEYYPVSRSQKRMFILNQINKADKSYNMPQVLNIEGEIDVFRLENAFKKIIHRHEILRTSFKLIDEEPVQIVNERCDFKLNIINTEEKDVESLINSLIIPFDLNSASLIRANYVKVNDGSNILVIDMHHIISDGLSMQIFVTELVQLYKGINLDELDIQYKDFSVWENNYLSSEKIKKSETYWMDKIKDFTYTNLPKNYDLYNEKNEGSIVGIHFKKDEYEKIDSFCKRNLITKGCYFTGILNIILMNELNKNDITIGMPVSGRNHNQLQKLIGVFLNTILIRIKIDKKKTFKEFLSMVNETLIESINNQAYPYEEIHDKARKIYGLQNESLFSIMLNYIPYQEQKENIELQDVIFKPYNETEVKSKYDVTFYVNENKDDMFINMVYKNIFDKEIIERIANGFKKISEIVLNNESIIVKDINYSNVEYEQEGAMILDDYFDNDEFFMND